MTFAKLPQVSYKPWAPDPRTQRAQARKQIGLERPIPPQLLPQPMGLPGLTGPMPQPQLPTMVGGAPAQMAPMGGAPTGLPTGGRLPGFAQGGDIAVDYQPQDDQPPGPEFGPMDLATQKLLDAREQLSGLMAQGNPLGGIGQLTPMQDMRNTVNLNPAIAVDQASQALSKLGLPDLTALPAQYKIDPTVTNGGVYGGGTVSTFPVHPQEGGKVDPATFIHESTHAFEDALNPQQAAALDALIKANPPPEGGPTAHHPPADVRGEAPLTGNQLFATGVTPDFRGGGGGAMGRGLTDYLDYQFGARPMQGGQYAPHLPSYPEPFLYQGGQPILGRPAPSMPIDIQNFIRDNYDQLLANSRTNLLPQPGREDRGLRSEGTLRERLYGYARGGSITSIPGFDDGGEVDYQPSGYSDPVFDPYADLTDEQRQALLQSQGEFQGQGGLLQQLPTMISQFNQQAEMARMQQQFINEQMQGGGQMTPAPDPNLRTYTNAPLDTPRGMAESARQGQSDYGGLPQTALGAGVNTAANLLALPSQIGRVPEVTPFIEDKLRPALGTAINAEAPAVGSVNLLSQALGGPDVGRQIANLFPATGGETAMTLAPFAGELRGAVAGGLERLGESRLPGLARDLVTDETGSVRIPGGNGERAAGEETPGEALTRLMGMGSEAKIGDIRSAATAAGLDLSGMKPAEIRAAIAEAQARPAVPNIDNPDKFAASQLQRGEVQTPAQPTLQEMRTGLYNAGLDGNGRAADVIERYNQAQAAGVQMAQREPPSGLPTGGAPLPPPEESTYEGRVPPAAGRPPRTAEETLAAATPGEIPDTLRPGAVRPESYTNTGQPQFNPQALQQAAQGIAERNAPPPPPPPAPETPPTPLEQLLQAAQGVSDRAGTAAEQVARQQALDEALTNYRQSLAGQGAPALPGGPEPQPQLPAGPQVPLLPENTRGGSSMAGEPMPVDLRSFKGPGGPSDFRMGPGMPLLEGEDAASYQAGKAAYDAAQPTANDLYRERRLAEMDSQSLARQVETARAKLPGTADQIDEMGGQGLRKVIQHYEAPPPALSSEGRAMTAGEQLAPTREQTWSDAQLEFADRLKAQQDRFLQGNGREMTPTEYLRMAETERVASGIKPQQVTAGLTDWLNLPRSLMAGADLSYGLRNMILLGPAHLPEFARALATGFRGTVDANYADQVATKIATSPYRSLKGALDLTETGGGVLRSEEQYAGSKAIQVAGRNLGAPGRLLSNIYGGLERGNTTMLNQFRSDVSDFYAEKMLRINGETVGSASSKTRGQIDEFNRFINRATGRGTLGDLEKALTPLGQVFFSLRSTVAKPQAAAYLWNQPGSPIWNEAAKTFASFLGAGAVTLKLANEMGAKVGLDPRSADFGKIVAGNKHIDIWGGYQQTARAMFQEVQGLRGKENAVTGTGRGYDKGALQVAGDWLANRFSPQAGLGGQGVRASLEGHIPPGAQSVLDTLFPAYPGRPAPGLDLRTAMNYLTPLWVQDTADALRLDGLKGAAAVAPGSFLGMGMQTYAPTTAAQRYNDRQDNLGDKGTRDAALGTQLSGLVAKSGDDYNKLSSYEKSQIEAKRDPDTVEAEKAALRAANDPFQAQADARDAITQKQNAERDVLSQHLQSGQADATALRQFMSASDNYYNEQRFKIQPDVEDSGLPPAERSPIQKAVTAYNSFYNTDKTPDGKTDYTKLAADQKWYIDQVTKKDPDLGQRLALNVEKKVNLQDHPLAQQYDKMQLPGGPVAQMNANRSSTDKEATTWREKNPQLDAQLAYYGYAHDVRTPEAYKAFKDLTDGGTREPIFTYNLGKSNGAGRSEATSAAAKPYVDYYYSLPTPAEKAVWLQDHPDLDTLLWRAGYTTTIHSYQTYENINRR